VWQASARLVINHPDLDRAELARKIQHRWSGKGNVNVQLFNEHKSASDSAADIIGNSLQHLGQIGFDQTGWRWPPRWHADYHSWLFRQRRGLQPLGISSQPRSMISLPCSVDVGAAEEESVVWGGWRSGDMEPMPIAF
jgi:hypothetical protein